MNIYAVKQSFVGMSLRLDHTTGEDYITGERKHKDPFSFKPYARFMYSCNDIPRNYGDRSEAFYRRLIIIRFSKSVPDEKRDFFLKDKLTQEADGILAWAIEGLKRLIANNYQFSETERTLYEVKRYKIDNNSVLAFVDDCCKLEEAATSFRQEMFDEYKEYCQDNNLTPMSQQRFKKEMSTLPGVASTDEIKIFVIILKSAGFWPIRFVYRPETGLVASLFACILEGYV